MTGSSIRSSTLTQVLLPRHILAHCGLFALMLLFAAGVLSCSNSTDFHGPRAIVAAVDVCEYCHMTPDDHSLAAQWVDLNGKTYVFDEPGCLIAWLDSNTDTKGTAYFGVNGSDDWVPESEAWFVKDGRPTSMGFNVVAYPSRSDAERALSMATGNTGTTQPAVPGARIMQWAVLRSEGAGNVHMH